MPVGFDDADRHDSRGESQDSLHNDLHNNLHDDLYGEELGDALRRTAGGFRPDTPGLVAAGHARGRRLRLRRNAMVTAAVAAVAAAGVGGTLAATGGTTGGSGHGGGVASAPQRPAPGKPSPDQPTSGQGQPAARALTAEQVEDILVSLLPKGGTASELSGRGTAGGYPYAQAVYDDGHGKGLVAVEVSASGDAPDCPSPNPDPTTSCTLTHIGGGLLQIYKGYEFSDHRADTKDWVARYRTASGAFVELSEWNSPQEKGAPVSRAEPPLDSAQMTALVTSPRWRQVIAALGPSKPWKG